MVKKLAPLFKFEKLILINIIIIFVSKEKISTINILYALWSIVYSGNFIIG